MDSVVLWMYSGKVPPCCKKTEWCRSNKRGGTSKLNCILSALNTKKGLFVTIIKLDKAHAIDEYVHVCLTPVLHFNGIHCSSLEGEEAANWQL